MKATFTARSSRLVTRSLSAVPLKSMAWVPIIEPLRKTLNSVLRGTASAPGIRPIVARGPHPTSAIACRRLHAIPIMAIPPRPTASSSRGRPLLETGQGLPGFGRFLDPLDPGIRRADPALLDHRPDRRSLAREHGLDRAVRPIAHPAGEPSGLSLALGPGAEPDPLHPTVDPRANRDIRRVSHVAIRVSTGHGASTTTRVRPSEPMGVGQIGVCADYPRTQCRRIARQRGTAATMICSLGRGRVPPTRLCTEACPMALSDTVDAQRANRRLIRESMSAPLLSREHELHLARRWRYDNDERGAARADPVLHAPRDQHRQPVQELRPAAQRPRPGGCRRPDAGGGAVRARARRPLLHLCRLVDPLGHAGLHPAQLVGRADRDHGGAEVAVLQPPPPARQDRRRPLRQSRRCRQGLHRPRAVGRCRRGRGHGDAADGRRPVAQRHDHRHRARMPGRTSWPTSAPAPRRSSPAPTTASSARAGWHCRWPS